MTHKKKPPPPVLAFLQAVPAPEEPCPDCCATPIGRKLRHQDSCPLMNSIEDVCDADRQWFVDNPTEKIRMRPVTGAELQELKHTDPSAGRPTHVIVACFPWGRTRGFVVGEDVHGIVLDVDDGAA